MELGLHNGQCKAYGPIEQSFNRATQQSQQTKRAYQDHTIRTTIMEDDLPPYTTINNFVGDDYFTLTALCQSRRVYIEARLENFPDPEDKNRNTLRQQFLTMLDSVKNDAHAVQRMEEWILGPCIHHILALGRPEQESLQSFFYPETVVFSLFDDRGRLKARTRPGDTPVNQLRTPRIQASNETVAFAIAHGVPSIAASQITVIRPGRIKDLTYGEMPTLVEVPELEGRQYFKRARNEEGFTRELDAVVRIQSGDPKQELRVPRLVGLVEWDKESAWEDEPEYGGILIEYIPKAKTLDRAAEDASAAQRASWAAQVRRTVEGLHELGVIWGDAKPDNVLVDSKGRAWVIDFNGGCTMFWVDAALEGTKEGDLQGLGRIESFLESDELADL